MYITKRRLNQPFLEYKQASKHAGSQNLYLKTSERPAFSSCLVSCSKTINNEITTHLKAPPCHNIHIYLSLHSPTPLLTALNYFNSARERGKKSHSHKVISLGSLFLPATDLFDNSATLNSPLVKREREKKNKRNASNYSCIMIALLSSKAAAPTQSSSPSSSNTS